MDTNEIINTTPVEIVAGSTVEWVMSLPHTIAGGYTGKFKLAGAASDLSITATNENGSYKFRIAPADTDDFATGVYFYQITTETVSDKYVEVIGEVSINALIGSAGYDARSVAAKIIDAIDALVLNRATIDQQSYQIGNRQLARIPLDELLRTRKLYAAIVDGDKRKARLAQGKSLWPAVLFKFNR